jgi:hypothetical protein
LPASIQIPARSFGYSIRGAIFGLNTLLGMASRLEALTPIGRVTIALLLINDPDAIALRAALQEEGAF